MESEVDKSTKQILKLKSENKELRRNLKKYKHLMKLDRCLRFINDLAVHEKDRDTLIRKFCEYLIDEQGYLNAWVVLFDKYCNIMTAVGAGLGDGFKVVREALQAGQPIDCCVLNAEKSEDLIIKNPGNRCSDCPLKEYHHDRKIMSVRLINDGIDSGILTVTLSGELENNEEIELFTDVAADLGFILHHMAVAEKARRYNFIVQTLPQTFSFLSTDFVYLSVNEVYTKLFDIPLDQIVGRNVADFFSREEFENHIRPKLNDCLSGKTVDYEIQLEFKTLGCRWMHMFYSPYLDDNGKISGIISNGTDITEQKAAENKYRYLVDTAVDSIMQISEDGIIAEVNASSLKNLGRSRDELSGKPITVADPGYSQDAFKVFWGRIALGVQHTFKSVHQKKDGSLFPVEISGKKVMINNRIFIISIARDITERERDRQKLIKAARKAEESDHLKSAFLANMSHEIRTPLNGILGFASLMNDPDITASKQSEYYSIINQSGQRLLTTINDLIDISRIETGVIETDISNIKLDELMGELYSFFKPELKKEKIALELNMEASESTAVLYSDRDKIYAVMVNLIKNAIKFTDKGRIEFGCSKVTDGYEFFVSDTGIGIAEDKIKTIFNRFIQADQSLTKPYEGSGLGLAISSEYIEILGGNISVESSPGAGSVFRVSIPDYKVQGQT